MIQHERAVNFDFHSARGPRYSLCRRARCPRTEPGPSCPPERPRGLGHRTVALGSSQVWDTRWYQFARRTQCPRERSRSTPRSGTRCRPGTRAGKSPRSRGDPYLSCTSSRPRCCPRPVCQRTSASHRRVLGDRRDNTSTQSSRRRTTTIHKSKATHKRCVADGSVHKVFLGLVARRDSGEPPAQ